MKQTYKLAQQTPMWHFQQPEAGITLRASEAKPKLDRFLAEWCRRKGLDIAKDRPSWVMKDQALDYRMTIRCRQYISTEGDMAKNHLYFGNMGETDPVKCKRRIRTKAGAAICLEILCFHRELAAAIDACLPTFFLLHNFGTRQGKGFGSFSVIDPKPADQPEALLAAWYGDKPVYKIDYGEEICRQGGEEALFQDIEKIYSVLKGGINFKRYIKGYLTDYFLGKGIGGEKRWMKQQDIAPKKHKPEHPFSPHPDEKKIDPKGNFRYIRGLLGLSPQQSWQSDYGRKSIQIDPAKESGIARIPSPILFKPVGSQLFILPNDVDEAIYGARFHFSGNWSSEEGELAIPEKDEFDMDEMFRGFVEYINSGAIRDKLKHIEPNLVFCKKNLKIVRCGGGKR